MSDAPSRGSARAGGVIAVVIGLLGAAYLVFRVGFHAIIAAAVSVGWIGFLLLCVYGLANFMLLGLAWSVLTRPFTVLRAATFCWGRAVRDCVGDVLPFSQFGGMIIAARAVTLRGIPPDEAFGSTIVDITLEMIAQIVFIFAGLAILITRFPGVRSSSMVGIAAIGAAVGILFATAFVIVQRRGFSYLERIARRLLPSAAGTSGGIDRVVNEIHDNPKRLAVGLVLHLIGWLSAAFGTWLALFLIGRPVKFGDAIAIESLLCAVRSAAVFIPAAIGVQEAGYAVMMPLFGLPAGIGIAVSLLKRAREIALAVPVLISWQIAEGRRALGADGTKTARQRA